MTSLDVLFIDTTTPEPYEQQSLATRGIGGTEATIIRLAEAFSYIGIKTGVMQHNLTMPLSGKDAYYLPLSMIDEVDPKTVIMLRGCQFIDKFPHAAKISFHQDDPTAPHIRPLMSAMRDTFLKHDVTVVGPSRWYKNALQELLCHPNDKENPDIAFIYNPVPDSLFVPKDKEVKYYKDKLVWLSSPHKGLKQAIELLHNLVEVSGNKDFRLHTFNPGYLHEELSPSSYVINHGSVPCADMWQHTSEALCVFYPTQFKETFGCIAAEANAVHTPVLTHEIAALAETVAGHGQFVKQDPNSIIDTVIKWNTGSRPQVYGQDRFRLSEVVPKWLSLFKRKNS